MKNLTVPAKTKAEVFFNSATLKDLNLGKFKNKITTGKTTYSNEDIANYLSEVLYDVFNGTSKKKYNINVIDKMSGFLSALLDLMCKENEEIDNIIISRVSVFPRLYKNYCETNNFEVNENFINSLESINDMLKPEIDELNNENNQTGALAEVESERKKLQLELENTKKELLRLKSENESQANQISQMKFTSDRENTLATENKRLNKDLRESATKRKETEKEIKEVKKTVESLQESNKKLEQQNNSNEEEKKVLLEKINKLQNHQAIIAAKANDDIKIYDAKIIDIITKKECNVQTIIKELAKVGVKTNEFEVYNALNRIQKDINIVNDNIATHDTVYLVQKPKVDTDKILLMNPVPGECKDIVFISDMHLNINDDNFYAYKRLNAIYDYCANNGINDIINLGDIFNTNVDTKGIDNDTFASKKELMKQVASNIFPMDLFNDMKKSNIRHYILGGNHDLDFASCGIDPINYIIKENMGLISLGYDNALIRFSHSEKSGDYIGLHHSGVPRDSKINNDPLESINQTKEFINNYYKLRPYSYSEDYLDLFGHTHRSYFNANDSYGIIPSLNVDRYNDGAWHVKIYFDENKKIDYMLIGLLNVDKEIRLSNQNYYKKIRTK